MPKDFFAVSRTTSLHTVPAGSKIHVIGVCGVAMAQLAVSLAERGYRVSGSDKEFYEPMRTLLESSPVETKMGYAPDHVPLDAALVVIGNSISYGNAEVDVIEQNNLPYTCFPKILQEAAISGKHSIVITGTHGKSTTTALIASILLKHETAPSYFVGGIAQSLPQSLAVGTGAFSVVEGDEYDSAFFAKVPKFSFYTPDTVVVNAIEFDHADIYPNVEAIEQEFTKLVMGLGSGGTAVCCIDFPRVKRLVAEWGRGTSARIVTFGSDSDAEYRIISRKTDGLSQEVTVRNKAFGELTFFIPMVGEYNARNALAALIVSTIVDLDLTKTLEFLAAFKSVKRRQEVRSQRGGVVLIEDFAHHPTAVKQTLQAVKEAFPGARITAIFEPRSNTSRRKVFQADYIEAFKLADLAILKDVTARSIDQGVELIDVPTLSSDISKAGVMSVCLPDIKAIRERLWSSVEYSSQRATPAEVVVVMSNGSFDGLNELLQADLEAR